jgi:site-specific recombinase XerD
LAKPPTRNVAGFIRVPNVCSGGRSHLLDVNIYRFRHTFAINFLLNGGDPWSLQMMLGHSTMEMVKTYLSIAQADLDNSHKPASPVDNWRL